MYHYISIEQLLIVSVIIFLVLHLWMIMVAFNKGLYWGLVCLFGQIFGTLVFSTETWKEQKHVVITYFANHTG